MSTSLGERMAEIVTHAKRIVNCAEAGDLDAALESAGAIAGQMRIINDVMAEDYDRDVDSTSRFEYWNENDDDE